MQIFGIHPADKNLNFLTELNSNLKEKYNRNYQYLRLEPNHSSHEYCIRVLDDADSGLLFFFCHALNKSIRGCHIESTSSSQSRRDFQYGNLISPTKNLSVFRGKKVFCLACNSKELGRYAITNGASVYLGFADIPFYITEHFKENQVEGWVKRELKDIVYSSLVTAIDRSLSFNELSILLSLHFDKRRCTLMLDQSPGKKLRLEVAKVLSVIKNGITMFGDGNIRVC